MPCHLEYMPCLVDSLTFLNVLMRNFLTFFFLSCVTFIDLGNHEGETSVKF
jgi:hypothetical protein